MEKSPADYGKISSLVQSFFRRGVLTNNFMGERDYRREMAAGTLSYLSWEDGLLFFCRREGFLRMRYHLRENAVGCPELPREPVVVEIPGRPGDAGAQRARRYWLDNGFVPVLRRLRLKLGESPGSSEFQGAVSRAKKDELPEVLSFLEAQFDGKTGCLPSLEDLADEAAFLVRDGGAVAGVLHGGGTPVRREIRHLAVEKELRGSGAAKALFLAYMADCPGKNYFVWVGEENFRARKFYEKCGFVPDGWTAQVLIRGKDN